MHPWSGRLLIDGHVHLHACHRPGEVLTAAAANFTREAQRAGESGELIGVLLLADIGDQDSMERLLRLSEPTDDWRITSLPDDSGLLARREGQPTLLIAPGRQIVTEERLEVLALGTPWRLRDGLPIDRVLHWSEGVDALTVLPWGAGKWLGRRGRLVEGLIHGLQARPSVLLGDSGLRPGVWRHPRHLVLARTRGLRILPGTDPLPLPGEERRIGSFGAALDASLDRNNPLVTLKALLCEESTPLRQYGCPQPTGRFLRHQLQLRFDQAGRACQ